MLAIYDRQLDIVRVDQPKNTGLIGHFYTFKDEEGRQRFELEEMLSDFEGKASEVITKLASREQISEEERVNLAIFIALGAFRTPDAVDSFKIFNSSFIKDIAQRMFADVKKVKDRIRSQKKSPITEEEVEIEAQDLVNFVKSGSFEITTNHQWAVGMAIQTAFKVAELLPGYDWVIAHRNNDKKSFITTDAPVFLTTVAPRKNKFYGVGFGNSDALVMFPLTESCALLMFGNNASLEHKVVTDEHIRSINLALSDSCQRFVIGRDPALVRSLADHNRLANKKWQSKMQMS
jgi:hypothetical protein